jgi:hypothetical protein
MDMMKKSGAISQRVFSLYVTNYWKIMSSRGSKILIGGYDINKYGLEGEDISWNPSIVT